MDRDELQERYGKGRKNFTGLDLSGLNLAGINMPCADLSGSNLSGADLGSANLEVANLSGANLSGAKLKWSKLTRANLYRADLRSVNMTSTTLGEANLEEANLEGANLFFTRLHGTNLCGANLKNVDLRRSFLDKVVLQNADLTGADLSGTNLQGSDLTGANLTDAKLDGVCWLEVQIDDPNVLSEKDSLIWRINNQSGEALEDLRGIDLSNSDLRQADLQNLDLSGINLSKTNLLYTNLSGVNLAGANLSGANLSRVNLAQANLTNANLSSVQFWETDFGFANLQGIQFEGTSFFFANLVNAYNIPSPVISPSLVPAEHPDEALVYSIRSLTEGLICRSEGSDPYNVFLWNVETNGEFTLEKFLRAMAYLSPTNTSALRQTNSDTEQLARAYQILLDKVEGQLLNIEMHQFETESLRNSSSVMPCLVIGRTIVGDWFGATTETMLKVDVETNDIFYTNDSSTTKAENERLISAVEEVTAEIDSLLPDSEGAQRLIWSISESRDLLLQNLLLKTKHFAIKGSEGCEYIFQIDVGEEEEIEQRGSFAELVLNSLVNIRVYFIGGSREDLYLIGQTQSQDWLGIRTEVTWT